jgi:glyoxylase I family protein
MTQSFPSPQGIHHVAIRARDFDASVRFYCDALGFVERARWGQANSRAVLLDTGNGSYIEIFAGRPDTPMPEGSWLHVAIRTPDCATAIERARAAGAVITKEPRDVTIAANPPIPLRMAFCKGPDGEIIEFFQTNTL